MLSLQKTPEMRKSAIIKSFSNMRADCLVNYINAADDRYNMARIVAKEMTQEFEAVLIANSQTNFQNISDTLSHQDAARLLHISPSTLYKWHEKGKIRGVQINHGKLTWSKTILEEYVKSENGSSMINMGDTKLKMKILAAEKKLRLRNSLG